MAVIRRLAAARDFLHKYGCLSSLLIASEKGRISKIIQCSYNQNAYLLSNLRYMQESEKMGLTEKRVSATMLTSSNETTNTCDERDKGLVTILCREPMDGANRWGPEDNYHS